jgi:hypothetical protein
MNQMLSSLRACQGGLLVGFLLLCATLPAQTYTASPISAGSSLYGEYPYHFTGLIVAPQRSDPRYVSSGSGAVVRNPRVVFSCAHVVFDKAAADPWLVNPRWHRAVSPGSLPSSTTGQLLRGYQYFNGYTSAAQRSITSAGTFAQDFVVHYAFEDTAGGGFAGWWNDGVGALKSGRQKLITGYPAGLYSGNDSRRYLMHQTGPFSRPFESSSGTYVRISEVSTGAGNSGGPAWVSDGAQYLFAGVLVSGLERSTGDNADTAGVYGVDSSSSSLIESAIRATGGSITTPGAAPTITAQPSSRRLNLGETATFSVGASGSGLVYRWQFNGNIIEGAATSTLTLSSVTLAQAGTYQAVVSNSAGEARSTPATLSVDLPSPVITTDPVSQSVAAGASVAFSVGVTGSGPFTYQWTFTSQGGQSSVLSGATSATLVLSSVQAASAGTYSVVVRNSSGGSSTSRPATLTVGSSSGSGPVNNAFANATVVSGALVNVSGSNVGANKEPGEPLHPDSLGGASVWWAWTAPSSGTASVFTSGSSFDTILAVYTGTAVSALMRIASDDDSGAGSASLLTFTATAGTTYRILVDGYGGATGSIVLGISSANTSSGSNNDSFANRMTFPGTGGTLSGSNASATREAGEPRHAGAGPFKSVWYAWSATASGTVTVSTAGSSFDTVLAVYTGSAVDGLTLVASNDDGPNTTTSVVSFAATPGTTYQIAVDGYSGASGSVVIMLTPPPGSGGGVGGTTLANDSFARPSPIGPSGGDFSVSSVGATKEPGEPDHANHRGGASLWWSWTAPSGGTVAISTAGSNFDTILAVYAGNALNGLMVIAANDDIADAVTSSVSFMAQPGQTYRIAVDGYRGASGNVRLSLTPSAGGGIGVALVSNDAFANRATFPSSGGTLRGSNSSASSETGEPFHAGVAANRSVWWTWTPSASGTYTVSTAGSDFDTVLAVYIGSAVASLASVASNDDESSTIRTSLLRFSAAAGASYQIAVASYGLAAGSIQLSVAGASGGPTAPANDQFARRSTLPVTGGTVEGSNVGASRELGEPDHARNAAARSVWWSWTPSRSGIANLTTNGSSFDTVLGVYLGPSVTALTEVASNDDHGSATTSSASFRVTAGSTYVIAVDGFNGASGTVRLTASIAATPDTGGITQNTRLANLSVRSPAGSGANTLVVGFAINGNSPKPILVRAIGPTLASFGLPGAMPDPVLTIYRGAAPIDGNDNWGSNPRADDIVAKSALVGAFPLDRLSRDAAILISLLPGAYTAQISAAGASTSGVALLETYDIDFNADADALGRKLINISSRAQVGAGENVMFAGFFVLGPTPKRLLIRGIGPTLGAFGVTGVLADSQIFVRRSDGTLVASSDNWSGADVSSAAAATGAFALAAGSRDAALIANLAPGGYTVELSGVGGATGVGLIEVYEMP